ncbi:MAG: 1-(5-phosphoribosyl)-5-[Cardiobacteriaceae bacterium]|nr:1-(5-phosphoribosyl)-5-[(5-phosphoribosylamino)methylideneamino]imidazole-4-carboxamide isomerase [Cardiobacteriaceae bacterium]
MLPIPAIDLKDGQCVRLRQGKMNDATIFADNPLTAAEKWFKQGARRLHIVDLDGAFAGSPKNAQQIQAIAKEFPELTLQLGGGIRDEKTALHYWDLGISYCIFGSKAAQNPEYVSELATKYPQKIIIGIDAKNGQVATQGWAELAEIRAVELATKFSAKNIAAIVYTDISRDGMMQGVNLEQTAELAAKTDIPVIASGGVSSLQDIENLAKISPQIYGAIIGRALYDGAFSLEDAYKTSNLAQNRL